MALIGHLKELLAGYRAGEEGAASGLNLDRGIQAAGPAAPKL